MAFNFQYVPRNPGHTYLSTTNVGFRNHQTGQTETFPVFLYRCDASGELSLIAEEKYEAVLDKLIESGVFAAGGVAS